MPEPTYTPPNTAQSPAQSQSDATQSPAAPQKKAEEPSGYTGKDPSTAGPGPTAVHSTTPENKTGHLNPSAPANTGTTPAPTPDEVK